MHAAIIAAGEGSRLREEGVTISKPLLQLRGEPMIDRLIRLAIAAGAESLSIIVNEAMADVHCHCEHLALPIPFHLVIRSTPGSMHSLFALAPFLRSAPFYCTTVDAVFHEDEFTRYLACARQRESDGVLAVTNFIDDERPLCVAMDDERRITAFSDTQAGYAWATGGMYYFSPRIFDLMPEAIDARIVRLRDFLRLLVERKYVLHGCAFSKIIDVDHALDIAAAEHFLAPEQGN